MTDPLLLETLKLLVEIAWADREVQPSERDLIVELAHQAEAGEREIEALRAALADQGRLPAPNLALLREHRERVLEAVDQLIAIDGRIAPDERAARDAVALLLARA